jgi:hypothetical protein
MKNKSNLKKGVIALICVALLVASTPRSLASTSDPGSVAVDVLLVRPFCFLGTICGSAIFVLSLPIAVPSRSVCSAAHALVVVPAHATFTRPLGALDPEDYDYDNY